MNYLVEAVTYLPAVFLVIITITISVIYTLVSFPYYDYSKPFIYVWSIFASLFAISLLSAAFQNPGKIPNDPKWNLENINNDNTRPILYERKHKAVNDVIAVNDKFVSDIRVCKWCNKIKPDRTHHCSRCGYCILRMDHHCPWINNCIGQNNIKAFILALLFAFLTLSIIEFTMIPIISDIMINPKTYLENGKLWAIIIMMSLNTMMLIVISFYLSYMFINIYYNQTTLEFCEKMRKERKQTTVNWNLGFIRNLYQIMGPSIFLWIIPFNIKNGDGTSFIPAAEHLQQNNEETRQLIDDNSNTMRV